MSEIPRRVVLAIQKEEGGKVGYSKAVRDQGSYHAK